MNVKMKGKFNKISFNWNPWILTWQLTTLDFLDTGRCLRPWSRSRYSRLSSRDPGGRGSSTETPIVRRSVLSLVSGHVGQYSWQQYLQTRATDTTMSSRVTWMITMSQVLLLSELLWLLVLSFFSLLMDKIFRSSSSVSLFSIEKMSLFRTCDSHSSITDNWSLNLYWPDPWWTRSMFNCFHVKEIIERRGTIYKGYDGYVDNVHTVVFTPYTHIVVAIKTMQSQYNSCHQQLSQIKQSNQRNRRMMMIFVFPVMSMLWNLLEDYLWILHW